MKYSTITYAIRQQKMEPKTPSTCRTTLTLVMRGCISFSPRLRTLIASSNTLKPFFERVKNYSASSLLRSINLCNYHAQLQPPRLVTFDCSVAKSQRLTGQLDPPRPLNDAQAYELCAYAKEDTDRT